MIDGGSGDDKEPAQKTAQTSNTSSQNGSRYRSGSLVSFIFLLFDPEQVDLTSYQCGRVAQVHHDRTHDEVATAQSTLKVTNIEYLYGAFKKPFVTVQPHSFYGVMVNSPTDLQIQHYNQWQPASCHIYFLEANDTVLAFFDRVCKTDLPLVVAYARRSGGDCSQTPLPFGKRFQNCPVLDLAFIQVVYTLEESDEYGLLIKK